MPCPVREKVEKFIAASGYKPRETPHGDFVPGLMVKPWTEVTPAEAEETYVAIYAYSMFPQEDADKLNAWVDTFFEAMQAREGAVIGFTAGIGTIYTEGSWFTRQVWGEHHEMVCVFKDLEAMRDFYQSDAHKEAAKYNGGEIAGCTKAIAQVAYVSGADLPSGSLPFSYSGARDLLASLRHKEFPIYQDTLVEYDGDQNVTNFELEAGEGFEEGYFQKKA